MKEIMVIINGYGEVVCELERAGLFYKVKEEDRYNLCTFLDEGDTFKVECMEVEEE